jgi:hypothetical protein
LTERDKDETRRGESARVLRKLRPDQIQAKHEADRQQKQSSDHVVKFDPRAGARHASALESVIAVDDRRIGTLIAAAVVEIVCDRRTKGAPAPLIANSTALAFQSRCTVCQTQIIVVIDKGALFKYGLGQGGTASPETSIWERDTGRHTCRGFAILAHHNLGKISSRSARVRSSRFTHQPR